MTADRTSPPTSVEFAQALGNPALSLTWSTAHWERVLRLARRLRLLARLGCALDAAGLTVQLPVEVRQHLAAEQRLSLWRTRALRWALDRITESLKGATYPLVLLKGAAYIGQDLPNAAGRLPSDLDILVPRASLDEALSGLQAAGWEALDLDDHDRRYYREWSHEVPPMRHPIHTVELDLHHNILPPLARTNVDADALLARLRPSRIPGWQVLDPMDQVLHSASHLFLDAEPRERVRDLADLDTLMRHFGAIEAGFWEGLPRRAAELGLSEPLALATHFTSHWFRTPIPPPVRHAIEGAGPGALRRQWMLPLWTALLTPTDPDKRPRVRQEIAAQVVLTRYHYHRLPLRLLLPHLWHKARTQHVTAEATSPSDAKR